MMLLAMGIFVGAYSIPSTKKIFVEDILKANEGLPIFGKLYGKLFEIEIQRVGLGFQLSSKFRGRKRHFHFQTYDLFHLSELSTDERWIGGMKFSVSAPHLQKHLDFKFRKADMRITSLEIRDWRRKSVSVLKF